MKKTFIILLVILGVAACNNSNQEADQAEPIAMEMKIDGMSCNGCVATVEASVKQMGEGITSVKVNLDEANAIVEFDKTIVKSKEIKKAIELNGYTVTEMTEISEQE